MDFIREGEVGILGHVARDDEHGRYSAKDRRNPYSESRIQIGGVDQECEKGDAHGYE